MTTSMDIQLRVERAAERAQEESRAECRHVMPRADCLSCRQVLLAAMVCRLSTERRLQDTKWGVQDHSPYTWLVILMEEVGEVAEAVLAASWAKDEDTARQHLSRYEHELTQVMAVAAAAQECIVRGSWRERPSKVHRERIDIVHEEMARMTPEERAAARRVLTMLTEEVRP